MHSIIIRRRIVIRIYSYILAALLILLILLSGYAYYATSTAILNTIGAQNNSLLEQANNFTQQFYEMVRNYGIHVFYSRAISRLRSSTPPGNYAYIESMRELRTYASSTDYIHSIYIYNASEQYVYSTLDSDLSRGSASQSAFFDRSAVSLLCSGSASAPVYRVIPSGGRDEAVISFLIYDKPIKTKQVHSSLLINVSYTWLERFLSSLLGMDNTTIYFHDGNSVFNYNRDNEITSAYGADLVRDFLSENEQSSYRIREIDGQKCVCFFARITPLDWFFLRIIPYEECFRDALALRHRLVTIIVCFAVCGLLSGVCLARHLYRPMNKLIDAFPEYALQKPNLSTGQIFSAAAAEIANYTKLLRMECLRQLLLSPNNDAGLMQNLKKYNIKLAADKPVEMFLVASEDIDIDAQQIAASASACETVRLNGQSMFLVQGSYEGTAAIASKISQKTGFCAYASAADFSALNAAYNRLQEVFALRIFLPESRILSDDTLIGRSEIPYPKKLESRILSALRAGNEDRAMQVLDEFIDSLSGSCRYSLLRARFKRLYQNVADLDASEPYDAVNSGIFFEMTFSKSKNIDELRQIYRVLFERIANQSMRQKKQQEKQTVLRVKQFIESNYMDPNLSLCAIAENIGLSVDYVGDLFRNAESVPVAKYINQVRFHRAKTLLLTTDASVAEISQTVGFCNPQYFFTLFKSNYHMTPNEYRKGG